MAAKGKKKDMREHKGVPYHKELVDLANAHKRLFDALCDTYDDLCVVGAIMHSVHVSLGSLEINAMNRLHQQRANEKDAKHGER